MKKLFCKLFKHQPFESIVNDWSDVTYKIFAIGFKTVCIRCGSFLKYEKI